MRTFLSILLCVLLLTTLSGSVSAENPMLATTADYGMLLDGKDFFSYTSSELYALWKEHGLTNREVRISGVEAEDKSPFITLWFRFENFDIIAVLNDPEVLATRETLAELSADQLAAMDFPAGTLAVNVPGIIGPFGVEVGMSIEELQNQVEGIALDDDQMYRKRYDRKLENGEIMNCTLFAEVQDDSVAKYTMLRSFRLP